MTRLQPFFSTIEQSIGHLHLTEIQMILKKELRNKSGIYRFLCKTNNKLYIGSSVQLSNKLSEHIKGSKSNILLQNAINKYTLEHLIFVIFEYCDEEGLLSREQFYLDCLELEFNILKVAGSSLGYRHTKESLAKFSEENNPMFGKDPPSKTKTLISKALKGKIHTPETKALLSEAHKSKIISAETRALMSLAKTGENNPIYGKIGEQCPNFGKIHTPETKVLMSLAKYKKYLFIL